jgi:hypothetical protein
MTAYSLRLEVTDNENASIDGVAVRRTTFKTSLPVGISTAKLFVVHNAPTVQNPDRVEYYTVACAADLDNLNEDAPPEDEPSQPYRLDEVTLVTDNPVDVDQFIRDVKRRIKSCLAEVKQLAETTTGTIFDISLD